MSGPCFRISDPPDLSRDAANHLSYGPFILVAGCWLLGTGYWVLSTGYWVLGTADKHSQYQSADYKQLTKSNGRINGLQM
jgi:hypothetical protein